VHDRTFVFSTGKYVQVGYLLLINGHAKPAPIELHTGERYRLRMINISDNAQDLRVRRSGDDKSLQWKIIAKDEADLPPAQLKISQVEMPITVGETYDVKYRADQPGVENLQIWKPSFPTPVVLPLKFSAQETASREN
jgi:FtsP/CotA-like multicopper oxidase with cupredoxin domain